MLGVQIKISPLKVAKPNFVEAWTNPFDFDD